LTVIHEDVGWFDIAMDDSHFFEIFQSLVNIRDNLSEVLIVERFLVDDAIFEIAFVA
jgi:hypothetical protein